MIHIIETLEAKKGKVEELKKLLVEVVSPSRKEKGCKAYDLYQEAEAPEKFVVVMCFADEKSYESHISAPHIASLEKFDGTIYHNVVERRYLKLS